MERATYQRLRISSTHILILTASVPTFLAQKSSLFRTMSSFNEPPKPLGEIIDHVERIRGNCSSFMAPLRK
jgi:hypothetical protein